MLFRSTFNSNRISEFHFGKSFWRSFKIVHCYEPLGIGNALNTAYNPVEAEQAQKNHKPPGIVHVRNRQCLHESGQVCTVLFYIKISRIILRYNRTDYRCCCQCQDKKQCQSYRGKKRPYRIFCFLSHLIEMIVKFELAILPIKL